MSESAQPSGNSRPFSLSRLICTLLVVLATAAGAYWYGVSSVDKPKDDVALEMFGLKQTASNQLADGFNDADGDLVADAPKDAAQLLDPDLLTFSYLATEQSEYREVWREFLAALGQRTGKQVEFQAFDSAEEQLIALQQGELHIAGLNSGSVPFAVNVCGFVPICSLGSEGKLTKYQMLIIARTDSDVRELSDLRNGRLTLTNATSNSGWKAPLAILLDEFQMQPIRDFDVVYSNGHAKSLEGIVNGDFNVAAVASDELALAMDRGDISDSDYKIVYTSEPFCNNVIGCSHRLKPELAAAIREAMTSIPWAGSQIEKQFSAVGASQFVPVSYREDLALVRRIDAVTGREHKLEVLESALPKEAPASESEPALESEPGSGDEGEDSTAGDAEEEGTGSETADAESSDAESSDAESSDAENSDAE